VTGLPTIDGDIAVSEADIPTILYTVRSEESSGNYTAVAKNKNSTASGAYMYTDQTWGGYGGYARAKDAPAAVQDARAASDVRRLLQQFGGRASAVFLWWYVPDSLNNPAKWLDVVPRPDAGNKLTVRQYAQLQLRDLASNLGRPATVGSNSQNGTVTATPAGFNPLAPITDAASSVLSGVKAVVIVGVLAAAGAILVVAGVHRAAS